jgi:hypothetical protein
MRTISFYWLALWALLNICGIYSIILPSRPLHVIGSKSTEKTLDKILFFEEKALSIADAIDSSIVSSVNFIKSYKRYFKGVAGLILCLYGGNFFNTVLLVQAVTVSGASTILDNFDKLGKTYRKIRATIEEVKPKMLSARGEMEDLLESLNNLKLELVEAKDAYIEDPSDVSHLTDQMLELREAYSEVFAARARAKSVSESLLTIQGAVDPQNIKVFSYFVIVGQ